MSIPESRVGTYYNYMLQNASCFSDRNSIQILPVCRNQTEKVESTKLMVFLYKLSTFPVGLLQASSYSRIQKEFYEILVEKAAGLTYCIFCSHLHSKTGKISFYQSRFLKISMYPVFSEIQKILSVQCSVILVFRLSLRNTTEKRPRFSNIVSWGVKMAFYFSSSTS